jgi:hypothetical protein
MATITDVQNLGYTCSITAGDVTVEQDALAAAQADASPDVIVGQAAQVTQDTIAAIDADGKLPSDPAARQQLAAAIASAAIDQLATLADARVEFHQRAVDIAQTMPDTWHVSGWGNELYVDCKPDGTGWDDDAQALLDALADPGSHSERVWQFEHPDPMVAAQRLLTLGYTVLRPVLGADEFTVDGGDAMTGDQLVAYAATAAAKPTKEQLVAEALAADPGLDDATKSVIRSALGLT